MKKRIALVLLAISLFSGILALWGCGQEADSSNSRNSAYVQRRYPLKIGIGMTVSAEPEEAPAAEPGQSSSSESSILDSAIELVAGSDSEVSQSPVSPDSTEFVSHDCWVILHPNGLVLSAWNNNYDAPTMGMYLETNGCFYAKITYTFVADFYRKPRENKETGTIIGSGYEYKSLYSVDLAKPSFLINDGVWKFPDSYQGHPMAQEDWVFVGWSTDPQANETGNYQTYDFYRDGELLCYMLNKPESYPVVEAVDPWDTRSENVFTPLDLYAVYRPKTCLTYVIDGFGAGNYWDGFHYAPLEGWNVEYVIDFEPDPEPATQTGFVFTGWATEAGREWPEYNVGDIITVSGPLTLHTCWMTVEDYEKNFGESEKEALMEEDFEEDEAGYSQPDGEADDPIAETECDVEQPGEGQPNEGQPGEGQE